jgi:hypothetical protein
MNEDRWAWKHTQTLVEDMLLFTSNNVTLLQCLYNRCSNGHLRLAWICSQSHFREPTEIGECLIMLVVHLTTCVGRECLLQMLAVHFPRSWHKCHLSAIVCIHHAACWSLPASTKFKVPYLCNSCELDARCYDFLTQHEVRNLILKLWYEVTRHPVYCWIIRRQ